MLVAVILLPVLLPVLLILGPAALAAFCWWRDRYDKDPGYCEKCGYDLTGLAPNAACPECGKRSLPPARD